MSGGGDGGDGGHPSGRGGQTCSGSSVEGFGRHVVVLVVVGLSVAWHPGSWNRSTSMVCMDNLTHGGGGTGDELGHSLEFSVRNSSPTMICPQSIEVPYRVAMMKPALARWLGATKATYDCK